jgi:hypothetical protein
LLWIPRPLQSWADRYHKILVHSLGKESAGKKQEVKGLSRQLKKKLIMKKPYNFIKFFAT